MKSELTLNADASVDTRFIVPAHRQLIRNGSISFAKKRS